ncbi:MAG: hypothetical protein NTW97_11660 [Candidatus Krumholzibacteria bacterium]|nr:hypothetical protein [Candidatus Krumholzibacteria bacterium]
MNRYLRSMPAALLIAFTFALIFAIGCSNDKTVTSPVTPSTLEVSGILCNPLAPAPGDTARLTVRAGGQGAGATYQWQVEAGTLIGGNDISIRWEAPTDPGVYMISVRASVGSEVRVHTTWVMVRRCEAMNTGLRYAFYPNLVEGELYCVGTNSLLSEHTFLGYHAYKLDNVPPTWIDSIQVTPPTNPVSVNGGHDFKFTPDGLLAGSITDGAEHYRMQPVNVIFYPYMAGRNVYWSKNEAVGTTYRRNQNLYPSASSGLDMVVWQRTVVGATDDGKKDLANIRFRFSSAPAAQIKTLTTAKDSVYQLGAWNYTYWRNIKPMFSPDDAMIIYFNDSTERFEPCLIPVDGIEPNLAERHAIMVDERHGIFFNAGVKVTERTIFQWNPADPTQLAFIDENRQFCVFDYVTETVDVIGTGVLEFVYSEDGKLAGVTEDGVYVLEPGQTQAKPVFVKERSSDAVIGINWSPGLDDQKLGFRMVRKGASPVESYSVLVIYSWDDDRWYYASPEIKPVMGTEPEVSYIWMRAIFDPFNGGMYVPVPLSEAGGKSVLYHSF